MADVPSYDGKRSDKRAMSRPRIRSIKPEFAQTERIGRLTRDARLLFIQLWTLADDEGRLRGNSRYLRSQLYPYDDDIQLAEIDAWIGDLETQKLVLRYEVDGSTFIQILTWHDDQKIEKPSPSTLPPAPLRKSFGDHSPNDRGVIAEASATVRRSIEEASGTDLDKDQDRIKDQEEEARARDDVDEAVQSFRDHGQGLDWVCPQDPTKKTLSNIRAQLREPGGFDRWKEALRKARAAPFLRGERHDAKQGPFRVNLDWFAEPRNISKILEGKYDQAKSTQIGGLTGAMLTRIAERNDREAAS